LREDVLPALNMSETEFAKLLDVSRVTVSELLLEKRALTADMAVRIATLLKTTPESWLRMQEALDLWKVAQEPAKFAAVKPLPWRRLAELEI
jgi:addiction module HigA family antidote